MNLVTIKRTTKTIREYEGKEKGTIIKEIVLIRKYFLNIFPYKTIKRFKKQYDGTYIEVNRRYREIDSKYVTDIDINRMLNVSNIKHNKTKDLAIESLEKISRCRKLSRAKEIANETLETLNESDNHKVFKHIKKQ